MSDARNSEFMRHLIQGVGSSGISLAITLITTPLMTRLFSAEAYGINGVMLTAATLVSAVGLMGLPVALAREQAGPDQRRLFVASIQMAVMLCAVGAVLVLVTLLALPSLSWEKVVVAAIFPLVVLFFSAHRIADSLIVARGLFPIQARGRVINASISRGFTLLAGWLLFPSAIVMLLGDAAGKLSYLMVACREEGVHAAWKGARVKPEWRMLRITLRKYRDFALHSNIAAILPIAMGLVIQVTLGVRLTAAATGQYVLAHSILTLPVSLFALATASIVFHQFVRLADNAPNDLPAQALKFMFGYIIAGIACMLPVLLFGSAIFAFVFGESWRVAGRIASILSVPHIFAFSLTGIISLFRAAHQIRAWLWFELVGTSIVVAGLVWVPEGTDLEGMALRLAGLLLAYQSVMHVGCLWASRSLRRKNLNLGTG